MKYLFGLIAIIASQNYGMNPDDSSRQITLFDKDSKNIIQNLITKSKSPQDAVNAIRRLSDDPKWNTILNTPEEIEMVTDVITDAFIQKPGEWRSPEFIAAYIGTEGCIAWASKKLKNKPNTCELIARALTDSIHEKYNVFATQFFSVLTYEWQNLNSNRKLIIHSKPWFPSIILHKAAELGNNELLSLFLPYISVDHQNENGETPLMCATRADNLKTLNLILEQRPSMNIGDKNGNTALMHAVTKAIKPTIVKLLIDTGADTSIQNKKDETALNLGIKRYKDTSDLTIKRRIKRIIDIVNINNTQWN